MGWSVRLWIFRMAPSFGSLQVTWIWFLWRPMIGIWPLFLSQFHLYYDQLCMFTFCVNLYLCFFLFGCQYKCSWLRGKTRLWSVLFPAVCFTFSAMFYFFRIADISVYFRNYSPDHCRRFLSVTGRQPVIRAIETVGNMFTFISECGWFQDI